MMNKFDDLQIFSGGISAFRFEAAGVLAKSLAKSGPKLPDAKLIAWLDRVPYDGFFFIRGSSRPLKPGRP